MARAYPFRLRCFLEGIEVPVVSANMTVQMDAPAQCQVQIPATDKAFEFLPRTLIHLFFDFGEMTSPPNVSIDTFTVEEEEPEPVVEVEQRSAFDTFFENTDDVEENVEGDPLAAGPVTSEEGQDDLPLRENPFIAEQEAEDRKWKLFFAGEVTGYQFVKSAGQRAVVLQCLDISNYWDTCYQYQVNVASLNGNGTALFVGAGTSIFDTFFQSSTGTLIDLVRQRPVSRPELGGLMGGIVHLLEAVGGVYGSNGFRGVNDFFTLAELRLHLVDSISASSDDTSSQRLFPRRAYNAWTRREGGRLGKIVSFRDMVNHLNKFIFHNVAPNPIARYEQPREFERTRTQRRTSTREVNLLNTPDGRDYYQRAGRIRSQLESLNRSTGRYRRNGVSSQLDTLANSTRNLKDSIRSWANENGIGGITMNLHRAGDAIRDMSRGCQTFERRGSTDTLTFSNASANIRTQDADYREFFARSSTETKFDRAYNELTTAITSISSGSITRSGTTSTQETETVRRSGRLHCQIIRPDVFMVAPPRCNVIFPEFYNSFSTAKQWLRMVTRMRMRVSDEIFGPDELLDQTYFAPDVEVLGARARQGRQASYDNATLRRAAYTRRLMDHELLTGPIPIFERMNEVNIMAARQEGVQTRGARVPYVTRAANHQFFKHRFSPHTGQVSGAFNPFVVCGFPAVVMDGQMTEEQVSISNLRGLELLHEAQSRGWTGVAEDYEGASHLDDGAVDAWLALRETVPTQHIGLVSGIQHSISQTGATTQVTMTSMRTHRDREELLGANSVSVSRRDGEVENSTTTVAALESDPPRVGMLGPHYGFITEVRRLDQDSGRHHLYGTFRGAGPQRYDTTAEVGLAQPAEAYGPEVVTLVSDRGAVVTFHAYEVTEEIDRSTEVDVEVPIEDFIRPPWMSDVYQNDRIGGVYQEFYGTGAITDPLSIDTNGVDAEEADSNTQSGREQDPIRRDGRTVQSAGMEITVERSIDLLVRSCSSIRHAGRDMGEFARSYTWRPIANLVDIMGSRDLTIDSENGEVTSGREGFHSRAFGHGPMGRNIANLIPPGSKTETIIGLDVDNRREEMTRIDKRADKADRVRAYVEEIRRSVALLG